MASVIAPQSLPSSPAPAPDPTSAERRALAAAIDALNAAIPRLKAVYQPIQQLHAATSRAEATQRPPDQCRERDRLEMDGGLPQAARGPRPAGPSEDTIAAERELAVTQSATSRGGAEPASATLATLHEARVQAAGHVRQAQGLRDEAVVNCAVDIACFPATALTELLSRALGIEAELRPLVDELRRLSPVMPTGGQAAAKVFDIITAATRAASAPRDTTTGPQLIEALRVNADANF